MLQVFVRENILVCLWNLRLIAFGKSKQYSCRKWNLNGKMTYVFLIQNFGFSNNFFSI